MIYYRLQAYYIFKPFVYMKDITMLIEKSIYRYDLTLKLYIFYDSVNYE